MAGFGLKYNKLGLNPAVTERVTITNSADMYVGSAVKVVSGFADEQDSGGADVYGIVAAIVNKDGIPLDKLTSTTDFDGTYTAGGVGVGRYQATSDNQTDKQIAVDIYVQYGNVYNNSTDGTFGTTSGANLKGNYTDLVDDTQIDENNNSAAVTTKATFMIHGADPDDSSKGLYEIVERADNG